MIYLVIGVTAAFLLTATLIFTVCHCLHKTPTAALRSENNPKLTSEAIEGLGSRRNSSRQLVNFQRQSYLQQSPMTEETISLDDFDSSNSLQRFQGHRRSAPKLIYTPEFSDGLMVLPREMSQPNNADFSEV